MHEVNKLLSQYVILQREVALQLIFLTYFNWDVGLDKQSRLLFYGMQLLIHELTSPAV